MFGYPDETLSLVFDILHEILFQFVAILILMNASTPEGNLSTPEKTTLVPTEKLFLNLARILVERQNNSEGS